MAVPSSSRGRIPLLPPLVRRILVTLGFIAAVAAPWWHLHIIDRAMPTGHADLADEWVGVRAALHGQNPYSAEVMRETQIAFYGHALTAAEHGDPQGFPYPAHLVILFAPLGMLSWHAAWRTFLAVVVPLLLLSFWLCVRLVGLPFNRMTTALAVFLAFCSWPVVWGLRLQQPTLLIVALVFIACFLLCRQQGVLAGILLALATVKPQLVLPLVLWLPLWACLRRLWSFVASFVVAVGIMLFVTEKIVPGWFPLWIGALHGYGKTHGELPLQMIFGSGIGLAGTLALVAWTGYVLWGLRRCPPGSAEFGLAVGLALSAAVCMTPTMLATIYNQVAVLPMCLLVFGAGPVRRGPIFTRKIALLLLGWGYAIVFVSALGERLSGTSNFWYGLSFFNPLLPVAITIAGSFLAPRRTAVDSPIDIPSNCVSREVPTPAHAYDLTFYRYIQRGATSSAEVIVPLLTKHLQIASVLDVGCGAGAWLAVYRKLGIPTCIGVDGDYVNRSSLLIPPETFAAHDVSQSFDLSQRFDLVQCLEVGEHIGPGDSRTLIGNLVRHSDCVLFSAAIPGQGGENHVNEQTYEFWRGLFTEQGYTAFDLLRPLIQDLAGVETWYRHNTILYVADRRVGQLPAAVAQTKVPDGEPIADVSSVLYRMRTRMLAVLPVSWLSQLAVLKHRCTLFFRPVAER
jgi:hypothetical protein